MPPPVHFPPASPSVTPSPSIQADSSSSAPAHPPRTQHCYEERIALATRARDAFLSRLAHRRPNDAATNKEIDTHENAMTKASPLVGRAAEFPELASHFRTAYSNLDDYIQYGTEQREIFPTCLGPKSEFVPDLHIACEELGTSIGAHPTTILDPGKPFSTISFRGEGAPLMILTEELHHPLLTSGLSNCSSVWICATDENQAKGVHALLHVTPVNTNAKDAIARISAKFKEWGFPRRALAVVTGAYTDPTKYDMPQSPMALRRTALVAGKLVECVSELGYENVVDHTRRNRPPFVTKEVNVGGLMQISERTQKIEFVPIGRGIFGVPEAFQSAHAGS